jgi:hypothetical protein
MTALGQFHQRWPSHTRHSAPERALDQLSPAFPEKRACSLANSYSTSTGRNGSWLWPVQQLLRSSRESGKSTAAVLLPD